MVSTKLRKVGIILAVSGLILTLIVIILGAFTRLTDSGLGCPDWPGCYGHWHVPHHPDDVQQANINFPDRPLEHFKAWAEMVHRYAASFLGLLVITLGVVSFLNRRHPGHPHKLVLTLVVLILVQGAFGMWTVTLKLYPPVVLLHLIGGFSVLSVLHLIVLRLTQVMPPLRDSADRLRGLAWFVLILVVLQIMSGAWTSANYAALACHQLPVCEGQWWQQLDFLEAFGYHPPLSNNFEYGLHLSGDAKQTIHIIHRFGAAITSIGILTLIFFLFKITKRQRYKNFAKALTLLLIIQVGLGLTNVIAWLPLWSAVAHNAVGALLLQAMIGLNYSLNKQQ